MQWFDRFVELSSRRVAQRSSRRSFLAVIGGTLLGGAAIPLLPVARAAGAHGGSGYPGVGPQPSDDPADPGDRASCDYWRYCGMDGFLCTCCGGTHTSCPPGTDMAPMTWVGTCRNGADGKDYIISYNDCCGKTSCGRCLCNRNESDKPTYRAFSNNDTNWCLGTASTLYHCTTAVILGVTPGK